MVGLDASGRTTALYMMKLGEVVTTIPTIGFNVETIEYKNVNFTMWDVGGCDKIRPLWRHYFQGTDAIIMFVDSNDRDRIEDAREELNRLLAEDELRDAKILVLANKQDLPNAMSPAEVSDRLDLHRCRQTWFLLGSCSTTGAGLFEGLDWLIMALKPGSHSKGTGGHGGGDNDPKGGRPKPKAAATPEELFAEKQESLLQEWLSREDEDDDQFLEKLAAYKLDSWDHRTHLRIAWLLLSKHGRKNGMPLIFQGIKEYIDNSDNTKRSRGTTFHETMTYFWVHMVHYALTATKNPTGDFKVFLLMNPQLSNGGLFLHYYSKNVMLKSPDSRTQVVLPDVRPLPSIVSSTTPSGTVKSIEDRFVPRKPMDDIEFLERFYARTLPSWGHETKIRTIWLLLKQHGREKGGTDVVLEALKSFECSGHNETISYFWLQIVTLCNAHVGAFDTYAEFAKRPACQQLNNPDLIDKHYSSKSLEAGKESFCVPDKKPLPSFVK